MSLSKLEFMLCINVVMVVSFGVGWLTCFLSRPKEKR